MQEKKRIDFINQGNQFTVVIKRNELSEECQGVSKNKKQLLHFVVPPIQSKKLQIILTFQINTTSIRHI